MNFKDGDKDVSTGTGGEMKGGDKKVNMGEVYKNRIVIS